METVEFVPRRHRSRTDPVRSRTKERRSGRSIEAQSSIPFRDHERIVGLYSEIAVGHQPMERPSRTFGIAVNRTGMPGAACLLRAQVVE